MYLTTNSSKHNNSKNYASLSLSLSLSLSPSIYIYIVLEKTNGEKTEPFLIIATNFNDTSMAV